VERAWHFRAETEPTEDDDTQPLTDDEPEPWTAPQTGCTCERCLWMDAQEAEAMDAHLRAEAAAAFT
jgi:hypothetical protein